MKMLFTVLFLICLQGVNAQPEGVGNDPLQNDVPLDGGISILAAAAAGYGAYKQTKAKKARPTTK
ncbi:MAG: hypothetical protein EAZ47_01600 [Bacteroidetes bacterium]|nr:MAG: hypothetical protein EAY72_05050 [Bacteroidota bacterium]TAF97640.1 MAG: hypothetical protein EAZ47_01600 [Bacteroidota bacterium]